MPVTRREWLRQALLLAVTVVSAITSLAQHGGGGGAPGGMPGGMPGGGGAPGPGSFGGRPTGSPDYNHGAPNAGNSPDSAGPMRGGLQLGPPGRWWDDKHFAKDLRLRPEQQHRMDNIFEANRGVLTRRLDDVRQEEGRFEALAHSRTPDEAALDAQIDRRSQARRDLEKAYTHYLLQLRGEMDADQLSRLEEHH